MPEYWVQTSAPSTTTGTTMAKPKWVEVLEEAERMTVESTVVEHPERSRALELAARQLVEIARLYHPSALS